MAQSQNSGAPASPNADQLRARIDRGETGDKVPASDPAAAPLGTDAEAGGVRPRPADVARDMRHSGPPEPPAAAKDAHGTAARLQPAVAMLIIGAIALVAVAVLIAAILPHAHQG